MQKRMTRNNHGNNNDSSRFIYSDPLATFVFHFHTVGVSVAFYNSNLGFFLLRRVSVCAKIMKLTSQSAINVSERQ